MRWMLAAALVTGCATDPGPESVRPDSDLFELEPGLFVPLTFDGKADLPNAQFSARPLDTSGYRAIADKFIAAGMDVKVVPEVVAGYTWPLSDSRAVLNRQGTPIRLGYEVYEHTGLDIIRLADTESSVVRAPTTGTAMITDWAGDQWYPNGDYSTVISIWDPRTHHIVQLMHVEPDPTLPKGEPFEVQKGQFVGELADIVVQGGMHTHVNVIDAEHFTLIDPVTVMAQYGDTTPPTIGEVYVLDAETKRSPSLQTGPLDLVITAHDRDDQSPRNLEIESIAYTATDQHGVELAKLERCKLDDAFSTLVQDWTVSSSTIRLIDFGNASTQFTGFWPSSDLGNPERVFRYAVTNLQQGAAGCTIVAEDTDGQLAITDEITELRVHIEMWDPRGNQAMKDIVLTRHAPSFIGDACETDAQCGFTVRSGEAGRCHPAGFCTVTCAGPCDDLTGRAPTFCIADATTPDAGVCVSKAHAVNELCSTLPGTENRELARFVGASGAQNGKAQVCAPAGDEP